MMDKLGEDGLVVDGRKLFFEYRFFFPSSLAIFYVFRYYFFF